MTRRYHKGPAPAFYEVLLRLEQKNLTAGELAAESGFAYNTVRSALRVRGGEGAVLMVRPAPHYSITPLGLEIVGQFKRDGIVTV